MVFSYYSGNIKDSACIGHVSIDKFVQATKTPKRHYKGLFEAIKRAELDGDQGMKSELKTKLYSITPASLIKVGQSRRYANIKEFTGFAQLDFDHIGNASEFKEYLFHTYRFITCAWLSPSQMGVKALARIPKCLNVSEFKDYYRGLAQIYGMANYQGFDMAPQNAVLPMFYSYDPNILYRADAEMIVRKKRLPEIKPDQVKATYCFDADYKVLNKIHAAIDTITDNGHPQLRAASFALGGLVGSGKIAEIDAVNFIESEIKSNNYLCKKPDVYIKTAKQMIKKGRSYPL